MYQQTEVEKKERRKIIIAATISVVIILILIVAIVVVATKKSSRTNRASDGENSSFEIADHSRPFIAYAVSHCAPVSGPFLFQVSVVSVACFGSILVFHAAAESVIAFELSPSLGISDDLKERVFALQISHCTVV